MTSEARGLFVSFEGIDGSGKSTQARLLAERLRATGREVVLTREPGGSPGAEEIRTLLLTGNKDRWSPETETLLFTAARRDHLERTILPARAKGAIVISDRFADSTRVYQGVARAGLRTVVDQLHSLVIGYEPDLTFLIDMEPRIAFSRSLRRLANIQADRSKLHVEGAPETDPPGYFPEQVEPKKWHASETARLKLESSKLEHLAKTLTDSESSESRFESLGYDFQRRLRQGFLALSGENPDRIVIVDGNREAEQVAAEVAEVALARMEPA